MDRQSALHFGVGLAVFSVLLMGLATNWLAAILLTASILFYLLVYTVWLKPRTAQNIVIGGAAGAFPPLIGWVAATGHIGALPLLLFAIIFLWTPPHFWALSLFVRSDYAAAGIPMLPVVAGMPRTRRQIFLYSLPMTGAAVAPSLLGLAGPVYGGSAAVLSFVFLVLAARVGKSRAREPAQMQAEKHLFAYSVFYLFALFTVLAADRWLMP
jgi:protoheme IX farnesyltransferase